MLGNLKDVRAALGRDLEIGDIVDYVPANPLSAEIVEGTAPCWHVIETHPNSERSVAAHLIGRRFGVFVPETEATIIKRGRKLDVTSLMFTGYVFVFVWDLERHWNRIVGTPGVARIMMRTVADGVADAPIVVPDAIIDEIRAVENEQRPLPMVMIDGIATKKKPRRWRKFAREKRELEQVRANEIVACRAWSAFQDAITTLDSEGRNQTLRKELGLSS